jgi:hypothetical protein
MKKFYSLSGVLCMLLLSQIAFSQGACPGPNPPAVRHVTYIINGQQVCAIYVENMIPNSPVTLFGPNLSLIPTASGASVTTDATGFACYIYPCNQTPVRITTCNIQGCCNALVPAATILPVRLTRFTGQVINDNTVNLDWTSAVELNSNKYVVERSRDGKNFEAIGTVEAAGNSSRAIAYRYSDKPATPGAYFYRLNQVDIDGKSEYSKVVYVNFGKSSGRVTAVFPNPFRNDVQLVGITTGELNSKNVRVFTVTGQQVNYRISGANSISIDDNNPNGVYILRVKDQTYKLVKQ